MSSIATLIRGVFTAPTPRVLQMHTASTFDQPEGLEKNRDQDPVALILDYARKLGRPPLPQMVESFVKDHLIWAQIFDGKCYMEVPRHFILHKKRPIQVKEGLWLTSKDESECLIYKRMVLSEKSVKDQLVEHYRDQEIPETLSSLRIITPLEIDGRNVEYLEKHSYMKTYRVCVLIHKQTLHLLQIQCVTGSAFDSASLRFFRNFRFTIKEDRGIRFQTTPPDWSDPYIYKF